MEPQTDYARALTFLSKLRYELKAQIRMTGANPLPQTRQAMVSLASRVWQGMTSKPPRRNGSNGSERSHREPLTKITKLIKPPLVLIHHTDAQNVDVDVDVETIEVFVEEDIIYGKATSQFGERRPQASQFPSGVNDKRCTDLLQMWFHGTFLL